MIPGTIRTVIAMATTLITHWMRSFTVFPPVRCPLRRVHVLTWLAPSRSVRGSGMQDCTRFWRILLADAEADRISQMTMPTMSGGAMMKTSFARARSPEYRAPAPRKASAHCRHLLHAERRRLAGEDDVAVDVWTAAPADVEPIAVRIEINPAASISGLSDMPNSKEPVG